MPHRLSKRTEILSEPAPPAYRVFILAENGKIENVVSLSVDDDGSAIEYAKSMVDGHAVDLWDGLRFIDQFSPTA